MKNKVFRVIVLFIGLCIAHLGVTLFLLSDLGADPFNVFVQGILVKTGELAIIPGITHGGIHRIISFLIIIILLFVDRSYIKIGTLICMFFGGPIIDFFNMIFGLFLPETLSLTLRFFMLLIGCILLAFGMSLVIKSNAGTGPNDLVALVISEKSKIRFGKVRVCVDVSFVVIGTVLGGVFGIGTIVCAVLIGPIADFFMGIISKRLNL